MELLDQFIAEYYKKLKKGGTLIIFFDLWKITPLKDIMEKHKFKQIRIIEWEKTNKILFDLLGSYCNKPSEQVMQDASRDLWLSADEALEYGIIDEIVKTKKKGN